MGKDCIVSEGEKGKLLLLSLAPMYMVMKKNPGKFSFFPRCLGTHHILLLPHKNNIVRRRTHTHTFLLLNEDDDELEKKMMVMTLHMTRQKNSSELHVTCVILIITIIKYASIIRSSSALTPSPHTKQETTPAKYFFYHLSNFKYVCSFSQEKKRKKKTLLNVTTLGNKNIFKKRLTGDVGELRRARI